MSFISLFDIIGVFIPKPNVPDSKIFLRISRSAAYAAAVNPSSINTLLANDMSSFFINGKPTLNNGARSLPRHQPDCIILDRPI